MDLWDYIDDAGKDNRSDNTELLAKVDEQKEVSERVRGLASPLASEASTRNSLQSIREQRDGLNKHRQSLLERVPERETFASFRVNSIEDRDLAYLSASTGDEFALLRGKNEDILYHGTQYHCHIEKSDILMALLESHKVRLETHTHPDREQIIPSSDDRNFIASIGQKGSKIVSSYTGQIIEFTANLFEDL
jgi:hypothetical protein